MVMFFQVFFSIKYFLEYHQNNRGNFSTSHNKLKKLDVNLESLNRRKFVEEEIQEEKVDYGNS